MALEGIEKPRGLSPEEAEQLSAELVSAEADPEYQELQQLEVSGRASASAITNTVQTTTALEAMRDALGRASDEQALGIAGVHFANLAIESVTERFGHTPERLTISVEGYRNDPKEALAAAMEDLRVQSDGLWGTIKAQLTQMADALVTKLSSFKKNVGRLETRVAEVTAKVEAVPKEAVMNFGALKPQDWFVHLCYHGKAAPKGLVGIGPAVEDLLNKSSKVMLSTVGRYNGWIKSNAQKALEDAEVFSSLRYKTSDFLILNQKAYDEKRRIRYTKADAGYRYYQSDELPGGMAFYSHLASADASGPGAVTSLANIRYQIEPYDVFSYNRVKAAVMMAAVVALSGYVGQAVTLGYVIPMIKAGNAGSAMAAVGATYVASMGASHAAKYRGHDKGSDGKYATGNDLKLTKDMIFETLTIPEAKRVLKEVTSGVKALRDWEHNSFKEVFKDKEAADLIERMIHAKASEDNRASARLLKKLCFAVLELQVTMAGQAMTYALRVYNAMLNYVQKSTYQYIRV